MIFPMSKTRLVFPSPQPIDFDARFAKIMADFDRLKSANAFASPSSLGEFFEAQLFFYETSNFLSPRSIHNHGSGTFSHRSVKEFRAQVLGMEILMQAAENLPHIVDECIKSAAPRRFDGSFTEQCDEPWEFLALEFSLGVLYDSCFTGPYPLLLRQLMVAGQDLRHFLVYGPVWLEAWLANQRVWFVSERLGQVFPGSDDKDCLSAALALWVPSQTSSPFSSFRRCSSAVRRVWRTRSVPHLA